MAGTIIRLGRRVKLTSMNQISSIVVGCPRLRGNEHRQMFWVDHDSDMISTQSRGNNRVELDQPLFSTSNVIISMTESWLFLETDVS